MAGAGDPSAARPDAGEAAVGVPPAGLSALLQAPQMLTRTRATVESRFMGRTLCPAGHKASSLCSPPDLLVVRTRVQAARRRRPAPNATAPKPTRNPAAVRPETGVLAMAQPPLSEA